MLPVPSRYRGMSSEDSISRLLSWRRRAPKFTTFRVNCLVTSPSHFKELLEQAMCELSEKRSANGIESILPPIWNHPLVPEAVVFGSWQRHADLVRHESCVIVDSACGAAVLRGAHVFVPGVLGLLSGARKGDVVSIYADDRGYYKRGWAQKVDKENCHFVGNGILLMDRKQLFCENGISEGIAVHVTDSESGCPSLPANFFSPGKAVLQNLPSIVCGRVVDPQPGELILDMCAAPGNKTTHLAALMNNEGTIIALDRSASRISKLQQLCRNLSVDNVTAFVFNSVKAAMTDTEENSNSSRNLQYLLKNGPPFPTSTFDRILLDAPCSGLGQRPKLEKIDLKHAASFPPLQKKLFESAVKLLKTGGTLVYSTCTVLPNENEGIVRWALDNFSCLELVSAEPHVYPPDPNQDTSNILTSSAMICVQKYVPSVDEELEDNRCERDTIGFFIARFLKRK